MNARLIGLFGLLLVLAGCNTHQRFHIVDTVARLPNGDEITFVEAVDKMTDRTYADTSLQWKRLAKTESLVQIQGQGEVRVKEAGKVLTVQGDQYFKTGRSVHYHNTHSQMTPDEMERSRQWREKITHAETRVSPDGNRAWLQYQGRTFASFDYQEATAIFGEQHQPTWAASASEK